MNVTRSPAELQFEQVISILAALSGMVERLRRVAGWLQAGRRTPASDELQLLVTQLDRLIATLAEGPAVIPLDGRELIAELRLVREDIASVGFFPNI